MDQASFDRFARAISLSTTRRGGLKWLVGSVIGAKAAADAGEAAPMVEGPCGNGSRKANTCSRNSQCCTDFCDTKLGKHNADGKGRCRCMKRGDRCTSDANCCGAHECRNGVCSSPCEPLVCPTCAITSIQAAIDAATAGDTILIGRGTYEEALTIDKTITLEACSTATIIRRDAGRTIRITAGTTELKNITVRGDAPVFDDTQTAIWGGINCYTGLILSGETSLEHCHGGDSYGGAVFMPFQGASLVLRDSATITDSMARMGGAVYLWSGSIVLDDSSSMTECRTKSGSGFGGAVLQRGGSFEMNGASFISDCSASYLGGGAALLDTVGVMNGASTVVHCEAAIVGGGFYLTSPNNPNGGLTMNDASSVTSNSAVAVAGGIDAIGATVEMNDASAVTGNSAGSGGGVFLGLETNASKASHLSMSGISAIVGNTATNEGGGILSGDAANTFTQGTGTVSGNSPDQCSGPGLSCQ